MGVSELQPMPSMGWSENTAVLVATGQLQWITAFDERKVDDNVF